VLLHKADNLQVKFLALFNKLFSVFLQPSK
jgi:hypothetical protein